MDPNYFLDETKFDAVFMGTSLTTSLVSAGFSAQRQKTLLLDDQFVYGSQQQTLTFKEFLAFLESHNKDSQDEHEQVQQEISAESLLHYQDLLRKEGFSEEDELFFIPLVKQQAQKPNLPFWGAKILTPSSKQLHHQQQASETAAAATSTSSSYSKQPSPFASAILSCLPPLFSTKQQQILIDLAPTLLTQHNNLISTIVNNRLDAYLEIKSIDYIFCLYQQQTKQQQISSFEVPLSRSSIFVSSVLSLKQKRLLMSLLELVRSSASESSTDDRNSRLVTEYWKQPFDSFLAAFWGASDDEEITQLKHFVQYALLGYEIGVNNKAESKETSLARSANTAFALARLRLFLFSLQKYRGTATFALMVCFGCLSELVQSLVRFCCLLGCWALLRYQSKGIIIKKIKHQQEQQQKDQYELVGLISGCFEGDRPQQLIRTGCLTLEPRFLFPTPLPRNNSDEAPFESSYEQKLTAFALSASSSASPSSVEFSLPMSSVSVSRCVAIMEGPLPASFFKLVNSQQGTDSKNIVGSAVFTIPPDSLLSSAGEKFPRYPVRCFYQDCRNQQLPYVAPQATSATTSSDPSAIRSPLFSLSAVTLYHSNAQQELQNILHILTSNNNNNNNKDNSNAEENSGNDDKKQEPLVYFAAVYNQSTSTTQQLQQQIEQRQQQNLLPEFKQSSSLSEAEEALPRGLFVVGSLSCALVDDEAHFFAAHETWKNIHVQKHQMQQSQCNFEQSSSVESSSSSNVIPPFLPPLPPQSSDNDENDELDAATFGNLEQATDAIDSKEEGNGATGPEATAETGDALLDELDALDQLDLED